MDPGSDVRFGNLPRRVFEVCHECPLEFLVKRQRGVIVSQRIGEDRQCKLGRARSVVSPFKAVRAVVSQVMPWVERPTVDVYETAGFCANAFVDLHIAEVKSENPTTACDELQPSTLFTRAPKCATVAA